MGYVHDSLLKDEKVIFTTKNHPIIFLWPVIILVVGLLTAMGGGKTGMSTGGPFLLIGAIWFVWSFIAYSSNEFAVTNKRVIIKWGVLKKITLEMNKEKIESLLVHQSLLGGMLNYGDVTVSGTGATKQKFPVISNPMQLKKTVQEVS
jgi:uncharacterized membrane protein YdbT with pleckstrin-like domain